MKLDNSGVLTTCPSCQTTNRLKYESLERAAQCGKCKQALPAPDTPFDVTSVEAFDAATQHSSIPVLVDFWAAWCEPCRMVAPEIAKVAKDLAGRSLVLKVDTDALGELSSRYGICSIPTIGVFHHGRELNRASGARPAAAIAQLVLQHQ